MGKKSKLVEFWTRKLFQIRACVISARKAKHVDATTMFTYSHANTPTGQSERAYYLSYFIYYNNRPITCYDKHEWELVSQQAFLGEHDLNRAPLKTPAWEAIWEQTVFKTTFKLFIKCHAGFAHVVFCYKTKSCLVTMTKQSSIKISPRVFNKIRQSTP